MVCACTAAGIRCRKNSHHGERTSWHDPEDKSDEDFVGQEEDEDEEHDGGARSRRQKRENIFVDDAAEDDGDAVSV